MNDKQQIEPESKVNLPERIDDDWLFQLIGFGGGEETDLSLYTFNHLRLETYFAAVTGILRQFQPPFKNAANQHFVDQMKIDGVVQGYKKPIEADSPEIYQIFRGFYDLASGIDGAMQRPSHSADWINTIQLAWPAAQEFGLQYAAVAKDLISLIVDQDPASRFFAAVSFGKDLVVLYDKIKDSPNNYHGTHANGYIAKDIKDTAQRQFNYFSTGLQRWRNKGVRRTALTLRRTCWELYNIPGVDDQSPWLRAE